MRVKNNQQIYSEGKMDNWLLRNQNLRNYFNLEIQGNDKEGCPSEFKKFAKKNLKNIKEICKHIFLIWKIFSCHCTIWTMENNA